MRVIPNLINQMIPNLMSGTKNCLQNQCVESKLNAKNFELIAYFNV